jgi:hypothetical protein
MLGTVVWHHADGELRTTVENLFVVLLMMAPLSQKLEPQANSARLNTLSRLSS